jgi:hypothetical protein
MDKRSDVYAPEGLQKIEGITSSFWMITIGWESINNQMFFCMHP